VTKCRWVVEVTNSFLKRSFKALRETQNHILHHINQDFRVAGTWINRFFKRLSSDKADDNVNVSAMQTNLY
jgi:hypothetical protein